ncbi:response regulator transcription factor [Leucobacter sp. UT-8R-CII-1-4]|uniref:response regulator transcription factor n=1 Tax=Leucobacter sp. UT-8R-CII-1-4 TaxID=3040075 RepID=UPI0024A9C3F8|nr:response regulator transcription factor [Leucobacter sp. UT-8R-CII-1-4]MDI6024250.1 response regulator transcription factor [Leucobacter sp. UT-8R-CII-1-4]
MKRLLLVEDDARLGPIIRDVLAPQWHVTLVETAENALDLAIREPFDVMIVDRGLPGMSGEQAVQEFRRRSVATPILILSALGQVHDRVDGLDAGANDYLVKPFEFEELTARLRALTREYVSPGQCLEIGDWLFYPDHREIVSPYSGRVTLTDTETALLSVFAAEPTRVFSREYLLARVFAHGESETTVESYVHYLRRKTDKDLIRTIRGQGYQLGVSQLR